jgi:hypothetical protein
MRRRSMLLVGPVMLAMSMWVYGQTGGSTGQAGGGQGGAAGSQGSASTAGDAGQGGQSNEAGAGSVSQPTAQQGVNTPSRAGDPTNGRGTANNGGGKTLKGCIRSQAGQYMLEEKGGKMASLNASEDLSAHVGHQVKVHGNWQKGTASANSGTSANSGSSASASNSAGANAGGTVASGSEPGNASANASAGNTGGNVGAEAGTGASDNAGRNMDHAGKTFQISSVDMVSERCNLDNSKGSKNNSSSGSQGMGQSSSSQGSSGQAGGTEQKPPQR